MHPKFMSAQGEFILKYKILTGYRMKILPTLLKYKWLVLVIAFLVIVSVWLIISGCELLSSFGVNLLTESIGIAISITIIGYLLKLKDKKENDPLYIAMLMDVHQYLSKNVEIWSRAFGATIKRKGPMTYGNLFSIETFGEIYERLNVDATVRPMANKTWRKWFFETLIDNEIKGNRVLDRQANITEPENLQLFII